MRGTLGHWEGCEASRCPLCWTPNNSASALVTENRQPTHRQVDWRSHLHYWADPGEWTYHVLSLQVAGLVVNRPSHSPVCIADPGNALLSTHYQYPSSRTNSIGLPYITFHCDILIVMCGIHQLTEVRHKISWPGVSHTAAGAKDCSKISSRKTVQSSQLDLSNIRKT